MVSLSVHVSYFDLNIVYTNMSGVTPPDIQFHPVQPISLLSPVAEDPLPGQIVPRPPLVEVEAEEPEYHVEAVEDSWKFLGTLQY